MDEPTMDADTTEDSIRAVPNEYLFSLAGAANACGVARTTIRRRLEKGHFPNARRIGVPGEPDTTAAWRIPARDLIAAGLVPNHVRGQGEDSSEDTPDTPEQDTMSAPLSRSMDPGSDDLAAELAALRERVRGLEQLAQDRAEVIADMRADMAEAREDYRMAMRLIGPGEVAPQTPQEAAGGPTAAEDGGDGRQPSPGFWGRLFGGGGA
jgi:hypothetical protein